MSKESSSSGSFDESNESSGMVDQAHGDFAADAITYLTGGENAARRFSRDTQEIDRQSEILVNWAIERKTILTDAYTSGMEKHRGTTAEHEVFYSSTNNRVVKRTYPGTFGATPDPKGAQRAATPLFYLERIMLMNRVFCSDLRFEGITFGQSMIIGESGIKPCCVISQPWIKAETSYEPHPSDAEIDEFMESLNFKSLKDSYYGWYREQDNITVIDARPDNFIKSVEGVIPIDLVITDLDLGDC